MYVQGSRAALLPLMACGETLPRGREEPEGTELVLDLYHFIWASALHWPDGNLMEGEPNETSGMF